MSRRRWHFSLAPKSYGPGTRNLSYWKWQPIGQGKSKYDYDGCLHYVVCKEVSPIGPFGVLYLEWRALFLLVFGRIAWPPTFLRLANLSWTICGFSHVGWSFLRFGDPPIFSLFWAPGWLSPGLGRMVVWAPSSLLVRRSKCIGSFGIGFIGVFLARSLGKRSHPRVLASY